MKAILIATTLALVLSPIAAFAQSQDDAAKAAQQAANIPTYNATSLEVAGGNGN